MIIVETSIFTRQVTSLLTDEEYREFQLLLAEQPDLGKVIKGGNGLRKARWAPKGRGKSGGVRLIYYWVVRQDRILMLFMYPKSERSDLTPEQIKVLGKIVKEEYP